MTDTAAASANRESAGSAVSVDTQSAPATLRLPQWERRRMDWVLGEAAGARVLEIGCGEGGLAFLLARQGFTVVALDESAGAIARAHEALAHRPAEVQKRVTLHAESPLLETLPDRDFDTVALSGVLVFHSRPDTVVREALARLRPGGRLLVTLPFGYTPNEQRQQVFGLAAFTELMRPLCTPERLSVEDGIIRFVGRNEPPGEDAWSEFGPEVLLRLSEQAGVSIQIRLNRELDWCRHELNRTRWSFSYQAGAALVSAAKNPRELPRLPGLLLKMYLAGRRATRTGRRALPAGAQVVDFPAFPAPRPQPRTELTIATILDPFSDACFRYEANLVPVTRKGWKAELEQAQPAFLFAESAWRGNNGEWTYLMTQYKQRTGNPLGELLAYCKAQGILTVFWNKEDPPNFDEFIDLAAEFDVVFTSDGNCIPRYQELCGHDRVYALPFAAQPMIHNPWRMADLPLYPVCFAGSWFGSKYPQRSEALRHLLDPALAHDLHIFDRNLASEDDRYRFPEKYQGAIKGSLPYEKMLTAYRCYRALLNTNSVTDSPTMFSRRVFEALACATPVVSTGSAGMTQMLGEHVRVTRSREDTARHLEELLGDEPRRLREGHLAYRFIHTHHTYRHRLREVMEKIGRAAGPAPGTTISVVMATNRPQNVERCLENFARQDHPGRELLLVLNNNRFDVGAIRERVRELAQARVLHVEGATTLGDCLNLAIDQASGEYVAKMDDDDHYGEHYLSDSLLAAAFSQAEIVGKGTYFTHLEGPGRMGLRVLRREHDYVDVVSGATLLMRRGLFRDLRFPALPRGTDTAFLADALEEGCRIYSADRYNFVLTRGHDPGKHTWRIDEAEFLKGCHELREGLDLSRAMI